jgi:hypothetical protein
MSRKKSLEEIYEHLSKAWLLAHNESAGQFKGDWYKLRSNINSLLVSIHEMREKEEARKQQTEE